MRFTARLALAASLAGSVSGCATIIHGTTQKIGISSAPTGASVTVNDQLLGTTPLFAELSRKDSHIVTIELPGYQPSQLTLTRSASGWVWGNIVFGGLSASPSMPSRAASTSSLPSSSPSHFSRRATRPR